MRLPAYFAWSEGASDSTFESWASAEELEQAGRMSPVSGVRFRRGRVLLRDLLARLTGQPPASLGIAIGFNGKPHLMGSDWHFSLSHSDPWSFCAASRAGAVGADLTIIQRDLDSLAISSAHFLPREAGQLRVMDPATRAEQFAALWALKEAHAKLDGSGIALGLARHGFELPLAVPDQPVFDGGGDSFALWKRADGRVVAVVCPGANSMEEVRMT